MIRKNQFPMQRGQSMVEFLVAMAVLLPLFLAITYAGRYDDIHQATIQASRYAAFQRVMQPQDTVLPTSKIEDQMRARFFVGGRFLNNGAIRSNDTAVGLDAANSTPLTWRDLSLKPLMTAPANSVTLSYETASIKSDGPLDIPISAMSAMAHQNFTPATVAHVEVSLTNRMDQSVDSPDVLRIGATTAAAGGGMGSSGSAGTRAGAASPLTSLPGAVNSVLHGLFTLFEPNTPELGCIKPDVVPKSRLEGAGSSGACQ